MQSKFKSSLILLTLSLAVSASNISAALPFLSPKQLQTSARMIVVGSVSNVKVTTNGKGNYTDWVATIETAVQSVEKGLPTDVAENLSVTCWRLRERPPGWAGPSGHVDIPANGAKLRMWLRKDNKGNWEPLQPNGIQILDGHSKLDFRKPDIVSKPVAPPEPEPTVSFTTATGTSYFQVNRGWFQKSTAGETKPFHGSRHDISSIYLQDERVAIRIPRMGGILQKRDDNGNWKNSEAIVRTTPTVRRYEFTPTGSTPPVGSTPILQEVNGQWMWTDAPSDIGIPGTKSGYSKVVEDAGHIRLTPLDRSYITVRMPSAGGDVETNDARRADVRWKIVGTTRLSAVPEAFRVASTGNESEIPPDPHSQEETLALVRTGSTWEMLNLGFRVVDKRYKEHFRDANCIQLQLIVDHDYQVPHTLTIQKNNSTASVVLPSGNDGYKRIELLPVAGDDLGQGAE